MTSIPGMSIRLHHCGFRQKTLKFNSVKAQMWQAENSKNHFGFELAATLRWFTAGCAIRIAVWQLSQTWKLRHYAVIDDVI